MKTLPENAIVKKIPEEFTEKGFKFKEVLSGVRSRVFSKIAFPGGVTPGYEVILRKIGPSNPKFAHVGGYTHLEKYPNDEAFGKWAWYYMTFDAAKKKFEALENG